jgi:hypothetical protein
MTASVSFLQALDAAARLAAATEKAYRAEAAERIRALERERSYAFRRLGLLQSMADAVARADSEEVAVAGCLALLRAKLGWATDNEARSATLTQFAPVPKAIFANLDAAAAAAAAAAADGPDVVAAMAAFEDWYRSAHPTAFWELFDQPMAETPLVDF